MVALTLDFRHGTAEMRLFASTPLLILVLLLNIGYVHAYGKTALERELAQATQIKGDSFKPGPGTKAGGDSNQSSGTVETAPKPKDWWDKASVVSQFFAGVIIAIVGLLITYTIQRTQIRTSQDTARAQLKSTELLAKENRRLQEGQLTAQLVEHLTSDSERVREIALVALRESVPGSIYDTVAAIIARTDRSEQVRGTAIQQLGFSRDVGTAKALGKIGVDRGRPEAERQLASSAASKVYFSTDIKSGTLILTASSQFGLALESDELEAGVFTHFLLRGLRGDADLNADSTISAGELSHYVIEQVRTYEITNNRPSSKPTSYSLEGSQDLPIWGVEAKYSQISGLLVGIGTFAIRDLPSLYYAAHDAECVRAFFASAGFPSEGLHLLTNEVATQRRIIEEFGRAVSEAQKGSLFVFYYSGHGLLNRSGDYTLAAADSDPGKESSLVPVSVIKLGLERCKASVKLVFLDASYSGDIAEFK